MKSLNENGVLKRFISEREHRAFWLGEEMI